MGFINQFPYSDWHELNIDWLLTLAKNLKSQMDYLMEEFAKIEVMTEDQIEFMIQQAIATNNVDLYNRMNQLKIDITNEYKAYTDNAINTLRSYTDNKFADQKVYIDNQDVYYDGLAQSYAEHAIVVSENYTDTKMVDYTFMINPITGEYEDVRDVVTDIVDYFHTDGSLTAGEYDALDLTAAAYDAYDLSAYDYDFNGKNLLV